MAEIQVQAKAICSCTSPRLKLFGIYVSEDDDAEQPSAREAALGSDSFSTTTTTGGSAGASGDRRKYECQYCCREFANSQALGGHQNAHKKERQQLKRTQMQQLHAGTGPYPRSANPMVSAFAPPPNLLSIVPAARSSATPGTSWVYFSRSAPPFHVSRGCMLPSASRTPPPYSYSSYAPDGAAYCANYSATSRRNGSVPDPPLSRFVASPGSPPKAGSVEVFGLDLQLSLAPAGS